MNKLTKKRNIYNHDIINVLIERYGFKKNYIEKSIRGDRTGEIPEQIKKEYQVLLNEVKKAIQIKRTKL